MRDGLADKLCRFWETAVASDPVAYGAKGRAYIATAEAFHKDRDTVRKLVARRLDCEQISKQNAREASENRDRQLARPRAAIERLREFYDDRHIRQIASLEVDLILRLAAVHDKFQKLKGNKILKKQRLSRP